MSSKAINKTELAKRYALALFGCVSEKGETEKILEELHAVAELASTSAELNELMNSRIFSEKDCMTGMAALSERAGLSETMTNFLCLLAENSRLNVYGKIVGAYEALYEEQCGVLAVRVVSALALDEGACGRLKAVLSKYFNKEIRLETSVDEGLIGGLTVQVGSRMIDASVRTKLRRLDLIMKGVGV